MHLLTFTGRTFSPLAPKSADIVIEDIAHALSHLCRFGGHTKQFYCPVPSERVLTADLRWVPAGDLKVGDRLLAFDEMPVEKGAAGKNRRRFRPSTVTEALPVKRSVIRLELSDGSTAAASSEHPWLVATKQSRNQTWMTAGQIATDVAAGRARYMHKFCEPWVERTAFEDGWVSGVLDGEGYISLGRTGVQAGFAQLPGVVLNQMRARLSAAGFRTGDTVLPSGVVNAQFSGGWRHMLSLLGTYRPARLLEKFNAGLYSGKFAKQLDGIGPPLRIVKAWNEGLMWVAGLSTSTRTYLCEGFGAHNSVAQHSVLVSRAVPPQYALWALLHDASEAYIVDVPTPLKTTAAMQGYRAVEAVMQRTIYQRFGLVGDEPAAVHAADRALLILEAEALFTPPAPWAAQLRATFTQDGAELPALAIQPVDSARAKAGFLKRFNALTAGVRA